MTNKAYVAIQSVAGVAESAMESLYDLFDGSSLDTTKWTSFTTSSGTVSEGSGSLSINCPAAPSSAPWPWTGIYSASSYDLTDSYAYLKCPVTFSDSHQQLWFGLGTTQAYDASGLWWFVDGTSVLYADYGSWSSGLTNLVNFPYDSSSMAWLRIRELNGTSYWDTSSDGAAWTNRASIANPYAVTSLWASIAGITYDSAPAITFSVSDFNTTGSYVYAPGSVTASAVVITSANALVGTWPTVTATFSYGDSTEDIRHALVVAVQAAVGDSSLDVEFVGS